MQTALSMIVLTAAISSNAEIASKTTLASAQPSPVARQATHEPQLHAIEQRLIERTNAARARYGLPALATDMALVNSARRHNAWMVHHRSLQHSHAQVAENIAMGQRSTAEVMNSWMNSSGHRANILGGNYRRIGVSAYRTPDGTIYWCQQFSW